VLHYRQKIKSYVGAPDEKIVNYTGKYTLRPSESNYNKDASTGKYMFLPGQTYTIALVIYGLEQIEVASSIESWRDGGTIERED